MDIIEVNQFYGKIVDVINKHNDMFSSFENIRLENAALKEQIALLQNEKEKIYKELESLRHEYTEFTKVSNIIKIDKENTLLKNELRLVREQLKKRMIITKENVKSVSGPVLTPVETSPDEPLPVETKEVVKNESTEEENQDSEDIEVYEKTIKGKIYYICRNTMSIYEKKEDESIGKELGKLEKINQKTKVVWY